MYKCVAVLFACFLPQSSHQSKLNQGEGEGLARKVEDSLNMSKDDLQAKVFQTLQVHDYVSSLFEV